MSRYPDTEKENISLKINNQFEVLAKCDFLFHDTVKGTASSAIAFELYSSIISLSSNRIVKAVDMLYSENHTKDKISKFVKKLNGIIVETINWLIYYLGDRNINLIESKYHSLYIITGLVMSKYDINAENLKITSIEKIAEIEKECLDIDRHIKENWFLDENRQIGFFAKKLAELNDMKH